MILNAVFTNLIPQYHVLMFVLQTLRSESDFTRTVKYLRCRDKIRFYALYKIQKVKKRILSIWSLS